MLHQKQFISSLTIYFAMNRELIQQMQIQFDSLSHKSEDGIEFWFARDLQKPLGYARWENFLTPIKKAIESCETTKLDINNHFRGVTKMVMKNIRTHP